MTEKMKPSGITWIGDVPVGWDVKRVKYVIQNNADGIKVGPFGSALTNEVVSGEEGKYKIYGQANLIRKDFDYGDNFVTEENYRRLINYEVLPDDIAVSMMGTIGKCSVVPHGIMPGIMDSHLIKIRLSNKMNPRYFEYIYESCVVYEQLVVNSKGSIMNGLNSTIVKSVFLAVPSFDEQVAIADFLDAQCAKIDSVIADIEKQIETLQKYKKSLITEAVTKGLNPNVPMRKSKIEYVSSVPDHWEEKRLNIVAYVRARLGWRGLTADEYVDEGYAFLSAFNIVDDKLDLSEELLNYITKFRYDESPEIKLHSGDVLLVKDGAGLGKCARIDDLPFETAPNGSLAVITPNEQLHYRYLHYFFVGDVFQQRINQIKNGMGVPHLPQGDLRKIVVPIPPMDEQMAISDYLDELCALVNPLLEAKEKQLQTMKQHRKSLIYEYVTGKKEVPADV